MPPVKLLGFELPNAMMRRGMEAGYAKMPKPPGTPLLEDFTMITSELEGLMAKYINTVPPRAWAVVLSYYANQLQKETAWRQKSQTSDK